MSAESKKMTANWFLGIGDHLELKAGSKTVRIETDVEHKAPFGTLIKYHVNYEES